MTFRQIAAAAMCVATIAGAGCGGISEPSANTTDSFPGTVNPGGVTIHQFSVSKTGEVTEN